MNRLCLNILIVVILTTSARLHATSWIVSSYAHLTENAQYVLVVLTDDLYPLNEKYSKSGLYSLEDATTPLWELNRFASRYIPSSDGRHLVEFGSFEASWGSLAVAFYRDGIQLHSYTIGDLVKDRSKAIPSSAGLLWGGDSLWDDEKNQLILTTGDGLCYIFSAETGEVVSVEPYKKRQFESLEKKLVRASKARANGKNLSEISKTSILDLVTRDYLVVRGFGPIILQDKALSDAILELNDQTRSYIRPGPTFAQRIALWWARMMYSGENYH